jgi:DNA end-binding protein Ku
VVPVGDALMMITMRYADEIREGKAFDFPSRSLKTAGVKPKELELARKLIEDMAGPFKPEEFEDTYNEDLMHRIEEKVKRGETQELTRPEGEKEAKRSAKVIDLMELLKQSIDSGGRRARKSGNGVPKQAASVSKVSDARKARATRTHKAAKPPAEHKAAARRKRA